MYTVVYSIQLLTRTETLMWSYISKQLRYTHTQAPNVLVREGKGKGVGKRLFEKVVWLVKLNGLLAFIGWT